MLVYFGILFVGTLIQPLIVLVALLASLISRRWYEALLGGLVAGGLEILADQLTGTRPTPVGIVLMAGVTLSIIAFLVRRELGLRALFEKGSRLD
jgi:hypothetical protein